MKCEFPYWDQDSRYDQWDTDGASDIDRFWNLSLLSLSKIVFMMGNFPFATLLSCLLMSIFFS